MTENIRVDDLWFSDDTLVLKAEQKIFRVTKSILAARSSVFRDMIAFPQSEDDESEIIDGSPVILLHDAAEEVEAFLRAVFDSSYFMPPPEPVDVRAVLGILRLSHKYDVHYLYLRAIRHLSVKYGCTSVDEHRSAIYEDHMLYPQGDVTVFLLSIIDTATEVGALWLLPIAYYRASSCHRAALRATIALGASEQVVQTCLAAQIDLLRESGTIYAFISSTPAEGCSHEEICTAERRSLMERYFRFLHKENSFLAPLDYWHDAAWSTLVDAGCCDSCMAQMKELHGKALRDVWDRLPNIFGLPAWPELNAMRAAAMTSAPM
ncbi:hypothetical protein DFH06DRAFT_1230124 [Mycena polygramma]|nr:hypothetical protein DFH06DRAFT_1230124 [Mycena polygramma]